MSRATEGWKWKNALEVMLRNSAEQDRFFIYLVENPTWKKNVGDKNLTLLLETYKWCGKVNMRSMHEKKCSVQWYNSSLAQDRWYIVLNLQNIGLSCILLLWSSPHTWALCKAGGLALLPCQPADNAALPLLSLVLMGFINGIIYFLCVWIWQHPMHSTVLAKVGTSECESRCQ